MKNLIRITSLLLITVFLFNCQVQLRRKPSQKVKKALLAKDGKWEVSLINTYKINNGTLAVSTEDVGEIGEYKFTKDEGGNVPSTEAGRWKPNDSPNRDILYSLNTDDDNDIDVSITIYFYENGSWVADETYEVNRDYSKKKMEWSNTLSIFNSDTVIDQLFILTNKGF